jgi:hypothetical protein
MYFVAGKFVEGNFADGIWTVHLLAELVVLRGRWIGVF